MSFKIDTKKDQGEIESLGLIFRAQGDRKMIRVLRKLASEHDVTPTHLTRQMLCYVLKEKGWL